MDEGKRLRKLAGLAEVGQEPLTEVVVNKVLINKWRKEIALLTRDIKKAKGRSPDVDEKIRQALKALSGVDFLLSSAQILAK